jgi:DNA-directed RNA polymerase specialized sigma subunit
MALKISKFKIPMTTGQILQVLRENPTLADKILKTLPERQEFVVRQSWGIGCVARSAADISRELRLTGSRIIQLRKAAFPKLRHASRKRIIEEYLITQRLGKKTAKNNQKVLDRLVKEDQ